jgi:Zn-dependent M28 family amino/carboxypeptidase
MSKVFSFLVVCVMSAAAHAAALDKQTSPWWGHIKVLAADDLQGRLTGTPGYRKAAEYVAQTFEHAGLASAGEHGFFQSVGLEIQTIQTDHSSVRLKRGPGQEPLDVTTHVVLAPGTLQRPDTQAPLVFMGYGIHLPEAGYDDFAGADIRGAVVVYIVGGPERLSGAQRAFAYAEVLPHFLEGAGAVGVISITAPKNREVPWARQKAAGTQPGMLLAEKGLRRYQGDLFVGAFDETQADVLFADSGHTFTDLVAVADAHQAMPHFRLVPTLDAHVEATRSSVSADNVVAELPGTDPALAGEAIVLSAHLDHLGTGTPDHGDGIFHGAMDDASGVASLLVIAQKMHAMKAKPHRSILFVAVCGEEKGLLGSRYFAAHPTRHAGHIVADINTDMFLPLYPLTRVVGFGADESSLGDDIRAVGGKSVQLVPDPQPDHLIFVRSDQYNFVRKGIPAVMLTISPRPGTPEQETYNQWFKERYHAQADDLSQPIDLVAADSYNSLLYRLALRVADAPGPPHWHTDSFFVRFGTAPLP